MYSIMIIDDEKAIRDNLPKVIDFKGHGFMVCASASDGETAWQKILELRPDALLLDICMPVLDGLGLLKRIRESELKNMKVILLSGYSEFAYAKQAIRYGIKAYITKPVDEDELYGFLDEIRAELDQRKSQSHGLKMQQMIESLRILYRSGAGDRKAYSDCFLIHILKLSSETAKDKTPAVQDPVQRCMEEKLAGGMGNLFRIRGCFSTYLVRKDILDEYQGSCQLLGRHLLHSLRKEESCAVLIDPILFTQEEKSFRVDQEKHLYDMATVVFWTSERMIIYEPDMNTGWGQIEFQDEEAMLAEIKSSVSGGQLIKAEEELLSRLAEMEKLHMNIVFMQRVSYRLYFMYMDILRQEGLEERVNLNVMEWREAPYFCVFEQWKKYQLEQLELVIGSQVSEPAGKKGQLTESILSYLKKHFREPVTVQSVASECFVNPAYLGRQFQKAAGMSMKQYVNQLRIEEAKKLLEKTDCMVYEIAEQVGFTDSKYFVLKFSEETGMSPSEYRKSVRN